MHAGPASASNLDPAARGHVADRVVDQVAEGLDDQFRGTHDTTTGRPGIHLELDPPREGEISGRGTAIACERQGRMRRQLAMM
jgi:hypothetical protein